MAATACRFDSAALMPSCADVDASSVWRTVGHSRQLAHIPVKTDLNYLAFCF
jgi:hypothetical protein